MVNFPWEYSFGLLFLVGLGMLIIYLMRRRQDGGRMRYGISEVVKAPPSTQPALSFRTGMILALKRVLGSRQGEPYEYRHQFLPESGIIETLFFCPRRPLQLNLFIKSVREPTVIAVAVDEGDGYRPVHFKISVTTMGNVNTVKVKLYLTNTINALAISLENVDDSFEYNCRLHFANDTYADFDTLRLGYQLLGEGRIDAAMRLLHKYDEFSRCNPWVCLVRAKFYLQKKEWALAEQNSLQAAVHGQLEAGSQIYGSARQGRGFETTKEMLEELLHKEELWGLDPQIGVSVLWESHKIECGLNGYHLKRHHQIFRVRRAVAGRFLRQVSVEFTPQDEAILHSGLRVWRINADPVDVDIDSFMVTDSESRNPFVTTQQEKAAVWILPDLHAGDVVEWSADALVRDRQINGTASTFEMINLFSYANPTVKARIEVVARNGFQPIFHHTHPQLVSCLEESTSGDSRIYTFVGEKYVPVKNLGFEYGHQFLNPRTGLAPMGESWPVVAESIKQTLLETAVLEDKIPGIMAEMLTDSCDSVSKLAAVFYWIRDKLKYGVFHTAHANIGKPGRAEAIVLSGFADCKDRSYLLHLACRELDIDSQFYMTSSKLGSATEELPTDQFDHVALRAKVDGKWLYLDPTNNNCLFGSVPFWYQGMKSLVLDEFGTIITLPEDESHQNRLVIREVLDRIEDGWVSGGFLIRARGHTARLLEEHWKVISLSIDKHLIAAQQAIGVFLPGVVIDKFDQITSTSDSDTFTVSGMHKRSRCNIVGDQRVSVISWDIPVLPTDVWRGFEYGLMYAFRFPLAVEIDIEFVDALAHSIREHSRIEPYITDDLEISEHSERREDAILIHRSVNVGKKIIRGKAVKTDLPQFFEGLERALRLTCVFDRARE